MKLFNTDTPRLCVWRTLISLARLDSTVAIYGVESQWSAANLDTNICTQRWHMVKALKFH